MEVNTRAHTTPLSLCRPSLYPKLVDDTRRARGARRVESANWSKATTFLIQEVLFMGRSCLLESIVFSQGSFQVISILWRDSSIELTDAIIFFSPTGIK